IVAAGSFKGAAEHLGISTALASKYVGRLEDRLGVRLLNRTTRSLSITENGEVYHQRCLKLLEDFDDLEAAVQDRQAAPKGRIRVTAPITFGEMFITNAAADFLNQHPGITLDLNLTDRYVNIVEEGYDLAVRIGDLKDSSLIARRLATTRIVACASPDYLKRRGTPHHPRDLNGQDCIIDANIQTGAQWMFREKGNPFPARPAGRFRVNSARAVREAALGGLGIALCPEFAIGDEVRSGRLKTILETYEPSVLGIFAVYPHNRHLASKIRVFVKYLHQRFSAREDWSLSGEEKSIEKGGETRP
ncbi:MAG TPA: LysR family transcriptional regulator, partial [Rhodospirillales bacterium]|nr:LysR family transcriptional regulator [Rhodospirillales bacterium]